MSSVLFEEIFKQAAITDQIVSTRSKKGRPPASETPRTIFASLLPRGQGLALAKELDLSHANVSAKLNGVLPWRAKDLENLTRFLGRPLVPSQFVKFNSRLYSKPI